MWENHIREGKLRRGCNPEVPINLHSKMAESEYNVITATYGAPEK